MTLIASAPSVTTSTTSTQGNWTISDPQDPTSTLSVYVIAYQHAPKEQVSAYYPLGRAKAVTVSDTTLTGEEGNFTIRILDPTTYANVMALLKRQRVLLIRTNYGENWYIRVLGDRGVQRPQTGGKSAESLQTITISFIEVDTP